MTLSKSVTPQTDGASSNNSVAMKFTLIELITRNYEPIISAKIIPLIGRASGELKSSHGESSSPAPSPTFVHSCYRNWNSAQLFLDQFIYWHFSTTYVIYYLTYLPMVLQFFVGPWPLFQFLNHIHSRYDSLEGRSASRKAANLQTDIHALSGIRTHDPSVWGGEDSSCLRPRGRPLWSANVRSTASNESVNMAYCKLCRKKWSWTI
jgi:hypothetical protein